MIWTARALYHVKGLRPGQLRLIRGAMKRAADEERCSVEYDAGAGRLHITLKVAADSVGEAATVAGQAGAALRCMPSHPMRLDLMAEDVEPAEAGQPAPLDLDLMRITDIAKFLNLSRQRVAQLASRDPTFPPEAALIGRHGRAYNRQAIEIYARQRNTRPGPRP